MGGLVGLLVGMGIPEYEAKRYGGRVNHGGILVSLLCESSDEISCAKDALKAAGGEDIASSGDKVASIFINNNGEVFDAGSTLDTTSTRTY